MGANDATPRAGRPASSRTTRLHEISLGNPHHSVVTVDCEHGAAVTSITAGPHGNILWEMPAAVRAGGRSRDSPESLATWIEGSRGGWEFLAPNVGESCVVDGRVYPFHGSLGRRSWVVEDSGVGLVTLSTTDTELGFAGRRTISVEGTTITVTEELTCVASTPRWVTWGSHLAFGGAILDGAVSVTVPTHTASAYAPKSYTAEPAAGLASLEFLAPLEATGRATIRNTTRNITATVSWAADHLRDVWVWAERNATQGWPWYGQVDALGIEPMSTWPDAGTRDAIGNGRATPMQPQERLTEQISLHLDWSTHS